MIIKPYQESSLLKLLHCLNERLKLSSEWKQQYLHLKKGHEGEQKLANLLKDLRTDCLILHNLLLEYHNTLFEIDVLLIFENTIYLIEVKYYEGDYYIDSDIWYTLTKKEIHHPILQLNRCVSLFRRLLQQSGVHLPVKEYVLFNHPEFTLYQADPELPIILPTQINRFKKHLDKIDSKTNEKHLLLAKKFLKDHIEKSPYQRLPNYSFEQIRKGIMCTGCHSLTATSLIGRNIVCEHCGTEEKVDLAILRSVDEFKLVFPDKKITTHIIYE
ncbi:nuclease-related domain-containing protein [Bacillus sp. SD088]|uniref:nuclease-related domain-containing protein n=1 Tax=Bacillus sp. SD088 TaxID=2782012 RepID=UPI001A96CE77|nr:nuclease-related domain-containing protein [Bacillus sp. SD088]MBO0992848.1 NERD domain-containing protein [Bacillus sp. SD088]